jgi:RNA polymerase sigma-70 factor (ECF subfamily)
MPPYAAWYQGREAVAGSWLMPEGPPRRLRLVPVAASGQPALAFYRFDAAASTDAGTDTYLPVAIDVLTLRGDRVAAVTAFRSPELFDRFDLPPALPGRESGPGRRANTSAWP